MDQATAAFWLDAIAAMGGVLWAAGAWFVLRTRQVCAEPVMGELQVASHPDRLGTQIVAAIGSARLGSPFGNALIESATAQEVKWHSATGPHRHRGVAQLAASSTGTRVTYGIETNSRLAGVGLFVVFVGAIVTVALYLVLREYVLASDSPVIRFQVLQMAQCVHVLWPPFLLAGLARGLRRGVRNELERTVRNAAFLEPKADMATPTTTR